MRKKADINVMMIVLMTLVLFTSMLFVFILTNKDVIKKLNDPRDLDSIYAKGESLKYAVSNLAEQALLKTYDDIAKSNWFIAESCDKVQGRIVFCGVVETKTLDSKIRRDSNQYFTNLVNENLAYEKIKDIQEKLNSDSIIYGDGNLNVNIQGISFRESLIKKDYEWIKLWKFIPIGRQEVVVQQIGIPYDFNVDNKISLNELGLYDFSFIYESSKECKKTSKTAEEMNICISTKLPNMNLVVSDFSDGKNNYFDISLESKRKFWIISSLRSINMNFLFS